MKEISFNNLVDILTDSLGFDRHFVLKFLERERYNNLDFQVDEEVLDYLRFRLKSEMDLQVFMNEEHQKFLETRKADHDSEELEEKQTNLEEEKREKNKYSNSDFDDHDPAFGWDKSDTWNVD